MARVNTADFLVSVAHDLENCEHLADDVPVLAEILIKGRMDQVLQGEAREAMHLFHRNMEGGAEWKKVIIEKGGVILLLKLLKEGSVSQVIGANVLVSLAHHLECAEQLVVGGAVPFFGYFFKEGNMEVWVEALAVYLLANHSEGDRCKKMLIEEGVIGPLLKLLKEGNVSNQVFAAKVLANLACDLESAQHLVVAGVVPVYAKILKVGVTEVQAEVAWAVSKLAANDSKCQDAFTQHHVIQPLVNHLAFETVEENFEDWMHFNKATSVLAVVMSISLSNKRKVTEDGGEHKQSLSLGDPASATTKARMKAMAAKALGNLAKGNTSICRTICETRALMCFAVLLDSGIKELQYYSATALMEITTVAVQNADLRRFFFRPSLRAFKEIVDNIVNIIGTETSDVELLIPCIRTIGNLARTFRVVERRIIVPLVGLLAAENDNVCQEASIAIMKFASRDNILALENSRAIIDAGVFASYLR